MALKQSDWALCGFTLSTRSKIQLLSICIFLITGAIVVWFVVLAARGGNSLAESESAEDTEERRVWEGSVFYQPLPGGAVQCSEQTAGEEEEAGGGSSAEGKCHRTRRTIANNLQD